MVKKTRDAEPAPSLLICERRDAGENSKSMELLCEPFVQIGNEEIETPVKKKG